MKYLFHIFFASISLSLYAQPSLQWQRCYGGSKQDLPGSIIATRDGGYIMTGSVKSINGDILSNRGGYDLWVTKINADGSIKWQKTYGGSGDDEGGAIIELPGSGYLIGAQTQSNDSDLQGVLHHGSSTTFDIWILKIDTLGAIVSQNSFGGSADDRIAGLEISGEGEYIACVNTESSDGDVKGFHGGVGSDIWVFTFTETGFIRRQQTYGGTKDDEANSFVKTRTGNYLISGTTNSGDGDVGGKLHDSTYDEWLVKLDPSGNIIRQNTYGGSGYEAAYGAIETLDHGYITAGYTESHDGDVSGFHGAVYGDAWVVKTDTAGTIEWQKCLGGTMGDAAYSVFQNTDSSYVIAASTSSDDGDIKGFHGVSDCWILKLSKTGNLLWQKTLGGTYSDANIGAGIMPAADSGYLVMTMTQSTNGDIFGKHGDSTDWDIWLVKLTPEMASVHSGTQPDENISFYPNPSNGRTKISYMLDNPSEVKIELYNLLGEKIRILISEKQEAGSHEQEFDLSGLSSGSYFFRVNINGNTAIRLIEVLK